MGVLGQQDPAGAGLVAAGIAPADLTHQVSWARRRTAVPAREARPALAPECNARTAGNHPERPGPPAPTPATARNTAASHRSHPTAAGRAWSGGGPRRGRRVRGR